MSKIPNNVVRVDTSLDGDFFMHWFQYLQPIHNLTNREMEVITCFVKKRYELSKVISDNEILDKVTMGEDTKKKIREELGISPINFQVIMSKLRKSGVIENNVINSKYIPNIREGEDSFNLVIHFNLK